MIGRIPAHTLFGIVGKEAPMAAVDGEPVKRWKNAEKQSENEEGCCSAKGISKAVAGVKWASVRKLLAIAIFIDTNGTPKKKNEAEMYSL